MMHIIILIITSMFIMITIMVVNIIMIGFIAMVTAVYIYMCVCVFHICTYILYMCVCVFVYVWHTKSYMIYAHRREHHPQKGNWLESTIQSG